MSFATNPHMLFIVPPDEIHEHPTDMPTDPKEIPEGPIEGWVAFAVANYGGRNTFYGPLKVSVSRATYGNKDLFVKIGEGYNSSDYWFRNEKPHASRKPANEVVARPRWYQSGCTLRFIRLRKTDEQDAPKPV